MIKNVGALMPLGVSKWLIRNTTLTFKQIAEFCNLSILEIQAIADGEVAQNIPEHHPINSLQLTHAEIKRCEADPNARLKIDNEIMLSTLKERNNKKKYVTKKQREEILNAIAWMLKRYPHLKETAIAKLLHTTKGTVIAVKEKTHRDYTNIIPKDPVLLGMCHQNELDTLAHQLDQEKHDRKTMI